LLSIEKLRAELTNARAEILVKKDGAHKKVCVLEEEGKKLLDEVKGIESELESSIKEEGLLIKEFKVLIGKVESSLEIRGEMNHILFAHLTAAESRSLPLKKLVPVQE
jgi:L-cysteine desulfidase